MADNLGSYNTSSSRTTVRFSFTTHAQTGAAVAPSSAFENADLRIYKDGSATQRSSANGITMTSPFDSVTGLHHVDIDLTDNTDAGFYAAGSFYEIHLVPDETVDGLAVVRVLAYFEIGPPPVNAVQWLGGTIPAVNVTGVPKVDATHLLGTAWLTPGTAGTPDVNMKLAGGTAVTLDANNALNVSAKYWAGTAITAASLPVATAAGANGGILIAGSNAATTFANLTVSGTSAFGAITATTISSTGTATFNALTVTNALTISGTTTLTGAVSLGSTLGVTGTATFAAINTGAIATSGTVTFNAFTCTNVFTVSGATTLTGAVTATSASNDIRGVKLAATGFDLVAASSTGAQALVDAIWDEAIAGHVGAGTTGLALNSAGSAGDPWSTTLPGAYGAGSAGHIVGTALPDIAPGSANGLLRGGSNAATTFANWTVSGTSALGAITCSTITASGAVAFQSTFAVTTSTSLGALSCTTLTASGAVALQSTVIITGATTFTGAVTATNASNDVRIGSTSIAQIQSGLSTLTSSQVNAEVVDCLNVDTYPEPGQEAPAATMSLAKKIGYLFKSWRNKKTQTATTRKLYADDGTTVDQKATDSDDATTFTKGELGTGP